MDNDSISKIKVYFLGKNIAMVAYDQNKGVSYFQYDKEFLLSQEYKNIFPIGIKRIIKAQSFNKFNNKTFQGLPPMIADSLPDNFGNRIFNEWIKSIGRKMSDLTPIDRLAYLSNRGMGALEYFPGNELPNLDSISLNEISSLVKKILKVKNQKKEIKLNNLALLNIFKLGTSAGGARPKVIISENKITKNIIAGDLNFSDDYNHYLVKLGIDEDMDYNCVRLEYAYYLLSKKAGIEMMESKLIDNKHFATKRFDRVEGKKKHVLTATGISGLDFRDRNDSKYENLFKIGNYINIPQADMDKIFRRMVFNYVFHNTDDHLKNHSFIYDEKKDRWNVSPAYDITYPSDPLNKFIGIANALSVNGKNKGVNKEDFLTIAKKYTISNPHKIIEQVIDAKEYWKEIAKYLGIPNKIILAVEDSFSQIKGKK